MYKYIAIEEELQFGKSFDLYDQRPERTDTNRKT